MKTMILEVEKELIEEILDFARFKHPKEAILLLRGDVKGDIIHVTDYLFPPYASSDNGSASFPTYMIPIDFRIIGTLHTHPTGNNTPSITDHHNFYGRVMVLIGYPYELSNLVCYTKNSESVEIKII